MVGVAAVTGITVFAGFRTVDKLSSLQPNVIRTITAKIFPFVRRKVKSYSRSVDTADGFELENEVSELLNCIVQNCIESWYCHISECQSPVSDARVLISNVTKLIASRLLSVDRDRFLSKVLRLYRHHLSRGFGEAGHYSLTSSHPYRADTSASENVVRYLHTVLFLITSKLLDERHVNCVLGKEILAQIIVKEVILTVVDIASEPEWLYNIVADILCDTGDDGFDAVNNGSRTSVPAVNSVDFQYTNSGCTNNAVDYQTLCQSVATTDYVDITAASGSASETQVVSSNDNERFVDLADAVTSSCSDEDSLAADGLDVNERNAAADLPNDEDDIAAAFSECGSTGSYAVSGISQDPIYKEGRLPGSNSSYLTSEQQKLKTLVRVNGHDQQLDSNTNTPPELLSSDNDSLPNTVSAAWKKWPSFGCILPSVIAQDEKEKLTDAQSASNVVFQMPRCIGNQEKEDASAETGLSTTSTNSSHTPLPNGKPVLLKTKSFCSSATGTDVKPCRISHSVSLNALVPECGSDFLPRRLSHFVRSVFLRSVRIPHLRSESIDMGSASRPEFESATSVEVSAAEASEDILLDHQPQFLFDSIYIPETEKDVPVSKPYTVYVISVRIIQTYFFQQT